MSVASKSDQTKLTWLVRKWSNLSLRSKFLILLVSVIVGFDLAFVALWQPKASQFIVDLQSREVRNQLATAGEGMLPFLIQNQLAAIHETLDVIKDRHASWIVLVFKDAEGNRIYPISLPETDATASLVRIEEVVMFRGEVAATICAMVDFSAEQAVLRRTGYLIVGSVTGLFALAMVILGISFEVLIGRRVIKLSNAADGLAEGNFDADLPLTSGDEIGRLVHRFAEMRDNVFLTQNSLSKAREEAEAAGMAKSQFLAVMSHEIRTPLNGMLGTLQLLEKTKLSKQQNRYLTIMEASGELLLHHVNDVLDMSRLDSGKTKIIKTHFDLDALAKEVIDNMRSVAAKRGNKLICKNAANCQMVWGDSFRIRQVLYNLVSNAIKFTRDGNISIEISQFKRKSSITLSVSDTGIGIAENNIDRIFSDFERLDSSHMRVSGGTGLGLGISRRIVQAMGGKLSVKSELGKGSTFSFGWICDEPVGSLQHLPVNEALVTNADTPSTVVSDTLEILVVEDNHINRFVVREMLENEGHKVTEAHNGQQGINAAVTTRFDLIFMDISMPVMGGIESTKSIRRGNSASQNTPIIALTAHAMPDDIAAFRAAGMREALIKPISRRLLLEVLQKFGHGQPIGGVGKGLPDTEKTPILNGSHLENLICNIGKDNTVDRAKEFVSETDEVLRDISSKAADNWNLKHLAALVHKLAGSAAIFGATRFREILVDIEVAAKNGHLTGVDDCMPNLEPIWGETKLCLNAYLDQTVVGIVR